MVRVTVTLFDEDTRYAPIAQHRFVLYRSAQDSTMLRADDAGVLQFDIRPGEYRLASVRAVEWKGQAYSWNVPLSVRAGMGVMDLTPSNAIVRALPGSPPRAIAHTSYSEPVAARGSQARAVAPVEAPYTPSASGATVAYAKEGGVGVLFSLLITGGGQIYAGKAGKGVGLLLTSVGAIVVGAAASTCTTSSYSYETTCNAGPLAVGAAVAIGNWIYSMASAPSDVREWNAKHSLASGPRALPHLARTGSGTEIGLALNW